ncbi:hypothetical protein [Chamaesiphon sp.]|uniref:hypothetical protein n=1 Tax=Chamaesiphon sp. TaxID=2814140 RepID=UPI0035938D62
MKRLMWYVGCCLMPLFSASTSHASPEIKSSAPTTTGGNAASLGKLLSSADYQAFSATPLVASDILAQVPPPPPTPIDAPPATPTPAPSAPANSGNQEIQNQLNNIQNNQTPAGEKFETYQPKISPSFSIFNPVGFGADNNLVFFSVDYQSRTRFSQTSDGEAGIGIGLGDAINSIGAEVSYSLNSFGSSAGFGSGGFSAKLHKRIGDDAAVAIGWNQFAKIQFGGGSNGNGPSDYPNNSYYLVGSKILRTREDINDVFSRVALTAGVGSGVFLPFDRNASIDRTGLNVFGSVGVRVARPISAIVEWTGQDLAAGVSVAPFDNFPLVITPAFRDITGAGDGARFVLGASLAFRF